VIHPPKHNAMQFSALQLAWMQELGIDKPWIPVGASPLTPNNAASVARVPAPGLADTVKTSQPGAQGVETGTFVAAGDLARVQVGSAGLQPEASPRVLAQRPVKGFSSGIKKSSDAPAEKVLDTRTAADQAATLEALSATIEQCNACGLCKERGQVVVGQGVMQPAIMVIGEGPGEQEDRQGLPFVGTSGVLLDNMLSSIGSSRTKDVYAANIVKCRPPANRNLRPAEIEACRPFLMRQIELVRPFSILTLGRHAAQTLLGGQAQLTEMREQPYEIEHAGLKIPVVVSYHPAYLLGQPSDKAAAWRDLQRVKALSQGR